MRVYYRAPKLIKTLKGHTDTVYNAVQLLNGSIVSQASEMDNNLLVWNLKNNKDPLKLSTDKVESWSNILTLRNGLLLSYKNKDITIWNPYTEKNTLDYYFLT